MMDHHNHEDHHNDLALKPALSPTSHSLKDYTPLVVVIVFIAISSAAHVAVMGSSLANWSMAIMGYFFLFFALFKFIDLRGFKEGFSHYDLLAQRVPVWGYIYAFVELAIGVLYLLNFQNTALYVVTIAVTLLNVVSVAVKLTKKEVFMCACLGTVLKVPLTTVTLIEYGLMGLMAVGMLFV